MQHERDNAGTEKGGALKNERGLEFGMVQSSNRENTERDRGAMTMGGFTKLHFSRRVCVDGGAKIQRLSTVALQ